MRPYTIRVLHLGKPSVGINFAQKWSLQMRAVRDATHGYGFRPLSSAQDPHLISVRWNTLKVIFRLIQRKYRICSYNMTAVARHSNPYSINPIKNAMLCCVSPLLPPLCYLSLYHTHLLCAKCIWWSSNNKGDIRVEQRKSWNIEMSRAEYR